MYSNNNTAVMERTSNFALPATTDGEFTNEDIQEDLEGVNIKFPRVKIPGGGGLRFELPGGDPENPDYTKTLEGVILYSHPSNSYWSDNGYDSDENGPPQCSSLDGVTGNGTPGGACALCSLNKWNSGEGGKGKACKNMRQLYLLRDGDYLPIQLTLSPTSLRPYADFVSSVFVPRRRGLCGSIVQIGLKRMNNGKDDYSVATFKWLYDFSGEQLANVKAYAASFKEQIRELDARRALDAIPAADVSAVVDESEFAAHLKSFAVATINGNHEPLPA
jgi:hypothetical protein